MEEPVTGTVLSVLIASDPNSIASVAQTQAEVTLEGFKGDKHAGLVRPSDSRTPWYPRGTLIRNSRQVSIVSEEELSAICAAMGIPELRPEWLGANLLLRGIPNLTQIAGSTRLFFSRGAVLAVDGENNPCRSAGKEIQKNVPERAELAALFPKAAIHLRGLVAWVEYPGLILPGDVVRVGPPK